MVKRLLVAVVEFVVGWILFVLVCAFWMFCSWLVMRFLKFVVTGA
jgi:hypothetical protein